MPARARRVSDLDGPVLRVGRSRDDRARSPSRSSVDGCSSIAWTAWTKTAGTPNGSVRPIARTGMRSYDAYVRDEVCRCALRGNRAPVSDDDGRELRRVPRGDIRASLSAAREPGDRAERHVRHSRADRWLFGRDGLPLQSRRLSSSASTTRTGLAQLKRLDIDPRRSAATIRCAARTRSFRGRLWAKGLWHALRIWDGWAHDWPYWRDMIRVYAFGAD